MWPKLGNFGIISGFGFRPIIPKRNSGRKSKVRPKSEIRAEILYICRNKGTHDFFITVKNFFRLGRLLTFFFLVTAFSRLMVG